MRHKVLLLEEKKKKNNTAYDLACQDISWIVSDDDESDAEMLDVFDMHQNVMWFIVLRLVSCRANKTSIHCRPYIGESDVWIFGVCSGNGNGNTDTISGRCRYVFLGYPSRSGM